MSNLQRFSLKLDLIKIWRILFAEKVFNSSDFFHCFCNKNAKVTFIETAKRYNQIVNVIKMISSFKAN